MIKLVDSYSQSLVYDKRQLKRINIIEELNKKVERIYNYYSITKNPFPTQTDVDNGLKENNLFTEKWDEIIFKRLRKIISNCERFLKILKWINDPINDVRKADKNSKDLPSKNNWGFLNRLNEEQKNLKITKELNVSINYKCWF